jgi:hypothetical protein
MIYAVYVMQQAARLDRVLALARKSPIVRPRDVERLGVPREYLLRLHRAGELERIGRGCIAFRIRRSLSATISPRLRAASHMLLSAFYLPWSFTTLERRIRSKCGSPFLEDHDAQNSTRRPDE